MNHTQTTWKEIFYSGFSVCTMTTLVAPGRRGNNLRSTVMFSSSKVIRRRVKSAWRDFSKAKQPAGFHSRPFTESLMELFGLWSKEAWTAPLMTTCGNPFCQLKREKKGRRPGFFIDAVKTEERSFQAREAHESGAAQQGGGCWQDPCLSSALVVSWLQSG